MRHEVRYGNSGYHDIHWRICSTQKEAVEFAERIEKQYRYIWLAECGEYKTPSGRRVEAWIDYWWSPAVAATEWGECPDAGWGQPAGKQYRTRYQPLLYKGKRFVHLNERASATAVAVDPRTPYPKQSATLLAHPLASEAAKGDSDMLSATGANEGDVGCATLPAGQFQTDAQGGVSRDQAW